MYLLNGSIHKILLGHNCFSGFTDFNYICGKMISLVEHAFNVKLPCFSNFEVFRIDITRCFNFGNNYLVAKYINNLSYCQFGKKKKKFYENECIYFSGQVSTFKIYNKLLEFDKNDANKLRKYDFDINSFRDKIKRLL